MRINTFLRTTTNQSSASIKEITSQPLASKKRARLQILTPLLITQILQVSYYHNHKKEVLNLSSRRFQRDREQANDIPWKTRHCQVKVLARRLNYYCNKYKNSAKTLLSVCFQCRWSLADKTQFSLKFV